MITEETLGRICRAIADELAPESPIELIPDPPSKFEWRQLPLDPEFSTRLHHIFYAADIKTWGDLLSHSKDDLLELRNLGETTIMELQLQLAKYGLMLK